VADFGHQVAQVMTRLEAAGKPATAVLTGYVVVTADDLGAVSALPQDCPACGAATDDAVKKTYFRAA
jgi:hypothetical protein